jgi:hypothetical protein
VHAAEHVCPRIGLDGTPLPPRLAATAKVFEAGQARLRHVEVIARLLDSPAARRLTPDRGRGQRVDRLDQEAVRGGDRAVRHNTDSSRTSVRLLAFRRR